MNTIGGHPWTSITADALRNPRGTSTGDRAIRYPQMFLVVWLLELPRSLWPCGSGSAEMYSKPIRSGMSHTALVSPLKVTNRCATTPCVIPARVSNPLEQVPPSRHAFITSNRASGFSLSAGRHYFIGRAMHAYNFFHRSTAACRR